MPFVLNFIPKPGLQGQITRKDGIEAHDPVAELLALIRKMTRSGMQLPSFRCEITASNSFKNLVVPSFINILVALGVQFLRGSRLCNVPRKIDPSFSCRLRRWYNLWPAVIFAQNPWRSEQVDHQQGCMSNKVPCATQPNMRKH